MYLHEATREPDQREFVTVMAKEAKEKMDNGNYSIVQKNQVPTGATILLEVWKMKHKRDINTRTIKKWKACLNIYI